MEIGSSVIKDITQDLTAALDKAGIMYRIFSRGKSPESIKHKIETAPGKYTANGKKIQDVIGIRIVFYFLDDVRTVCDYLCNQYRADTYLDKSDSKADVENTAGLNYTEIFSPQRLNLIFKMNETRAENFAVDIKESELDADVAELIDATYEVQLRSVLSEGWHEVEHDLRYKCRGDKSWEYCEAESRLLNAIYATLETSENALELLFERISHENYLKKDWEAMLRNHFRLRLNVYEHLSEKINDVLGSNKDVAKQIFRISRKALQCKLFQIDISYPLNYDNLVFFLNRIMIKDTCELICDLEPKVVKEKLDKLATLRIN